MASHKLLSSKLGTRRVPIGGCSPLTIGFMIEHNGGGSLFGIYNSEHLFKQNTL